MDKILNQFLAVAEAGSISRAATVLFVTQPTLTFNMRKLEEDMGVQLLIRTPRGVTLTAYGETLYQNARLMRRLYDNTVRAISEQRERTEQSLRIGSGYSWWSLFLCDMVVDYSQRYPNSRIHVTLGNQLRCMDQLLSGDISLFIAHEIDGLNRNIGAQFLPLARVNQGYFVREEHPLLGKPRDLTEIEMYPAVTSSLPEIRHRRFFENWSRDTPSGDPANLDSHVFASNSLSACIDFIVQSNAVIQHTEVLAAEFAKRGLRQVSLNQPPDNNLCGIYVLSDRAQEPRVLTLINNIRDAAGKILQKNACLG